MKTMLTQCCDKDIISEAPPYCSACMQENPQIYMVWEPITKKVVAKFVLVVLLTSLLTALFTYLDI